MNKPPKGNSLRELNLHTAMLKVTQQNDPDMTVKVSEGSFWNGTSFIEYDGGSTSIITAPNIGSRYVVVSLNKDAALTLTYGVQSNGAQDLPTLTKDLLPLAAILVSYNTTKITKDLIYDIKPIINLPSSSSNTDLTAYYTKTDIDNKLLALNPANLADYYTKKEVDDFISGKITMAVGIDLTNYYTKADIDNKLTANQPQDLTNYYNKSEVDADLLLKSNVADVDNALALKANVDDLKLKADITDLDKKANIDDVDKALSLKVGFSDTYTKTEIDAKLEKTINLSNDYTKTDVDNALANKADLTSVYTKADIDAKISSISTSGVDLTDYCKKSEVDDDLKLKANVTDVYTKAEVDAKIPVVDLTNYYKKSEVDDGLLLKANSADVYTKAEVDTNLNSKINSSDALLSFSKKADLVGANDIEISDATKGLVLTSPGGFKFRITVDDSGVLTANKI